MSWNKSSLTCFGQAFFYLIYLFVWFWWHKCYWLYLLLSPWDYSTGELFRAPASPWVVWRQRNIGSSLLSYADKFLAHKEALGNMQRVLTTAGRCSGPLLVEGYKMCPCRLPHTPAAPVEKAFLQKTKWVPAFKISLTSNEINDLKSGRLIAVSKHTCAAWQRDLAATGKWLPLKPSM